MTCIPKTIVIRYRDTSDRPLTTTRDVYFDRAFGYYVRWNKRMLSVNPERLIMEVPSLRAMDLTHLADRCAKFILTVGDHRGVSQRDLARYIDAYRDSGLKDRDEVHQLLAKTPNLAHKDATDGWRFWPRLVAPEDAVRA